MRLNWLSYNYRETDGYGRFANRLILALRRAGAYVSPWHCETPRMAPWMQKEQGVDWSIPTISCLPPYYLNRLPHMASGPHWLLTMTEGSVMPAGWATLINNSNITRLIVPCEHNAQVFREGGVNCPVSVIAGGTDPHEFPLVRRPYRMVSATAPYTFLCLADRGERKGWYEAYNAFFQAFGPFAYDEPRDVHLVIKCRPRGNELIDFILSKQPKLLPCLTILTEDFEDMADLYRRVDCVVIPSRTEGWGMPQREAAMMGLPVITQAYSGLDDGYTRQWAMVVEQGRMQPISDMGQHIAGEWRVADVDELAAKMRACYEAPWQTHKRASFARQWLKNNQTWDHAALKLLTLMDNEGLFPDMAMPETPAISGYGGEVIAWPI